MSTLTKKQEPQSQRLPIVTDEMEAMMASADARLRAEGREPGERVTLADLDEKVKSR